MRLFVTLFPFQMRKTLVATTGRLEIAEAAASP
jgi:hypothetical protein